MKKFAAIIAIAIALMLVFTIIGVNAESSDATTEFQGREPVTVEYTYDMGDGEEVDSAAADTSAAAASETSETAKASGTSETAKTSGTAAADTSAAAGTANKNNTQTTKTAAANQTSGSVQTQTAASEQTAVSAEAAPKTRQQIVADEILKRGSYGRLYIDAVGVDTAVFYTDNYDELQNIVDAEDSACMFHWDDGNNMIADHCYQGFEGIKSCQRGTYSELVTANGTHGYTCMEIIYNGWNTGDCLTYNDGTPLSSVYTNCLIVYTCNTNGTVTITVWA